MQLPFNLDDVRFISINGDTVKFVLANGFVEVKLDARARATAQASSAKPTVSRTDSKHIFFQDGIYGI